MLFLRFLLMFSTILFNSNNFAQTYFHGVHSSIECCECSNSNSSNVQKGIPIFIFPVHVQKEVDGILFDVEMERQNAFKNNDHMAERIFNKLAHKFPKKLFMVGVGRSCDNDLRILKEQLGDFLHGIHTFHNAFESRLIKNQNSTELWYFVRVMEPTGEGAEINSEQDKLVQQKMAQCVRNATKNCIPVNLASTCSLDFLTLIAVQQQQKTEPFAIYASEKMPFKMLNMVQQCTEVR